MSKEETKVDEKVQEAIDNLDIPELAYRISQLALKVLSGKELETKDYYVRLTIPVEIATVIENVSKAQDINVEEVLSKMTNNEFIRSIQGAANDIQKPEEKKEEPEDMTGIPQLDGIMKGLGKIQELGDQLGKMQGIFDEIAPKGQQDPKDSK